MEKTGHCLCGAVRFTAEVPSGIGVCHCGQCRRWASGPYFAAAAKSVSFEGAEHIGRYRSSDWAERGYCKTCGGHLFYRMIQEDRYMMAVGAFDDPAGFELVRQVFVDNKPDYYAIAQQTQTSTGDDFFTRFPALKGR